jgi:hypothetical protein
MTNTKVDTKRNAGRPNEIYKLCIAMVAHGVIYRRPGVKPKQATAAATTLLCDLWRQEGEEFRDDEKFNVAVRKRFSPKRAAASRKQLRKSSAVCRSRPQGRFAPLFPPVRDCFHRCAARNCCKEFIL